MHSIKIPFNENTTECIEIYPDELPEDSSEVLDLLRGQYAPLKKWKLVAVEYFKCGMQFDFEKILEEIVSAMENRDVVVHYKETGEFKEGMVDIFGVLAAYSLGKMRNEINEKLYNEEKVEYFLKKADEINSMNEFTMIIKGFLELKRGDLKHADTQFSYVYKSCSSASSTHKKQFLYGAMLGMGAVAYQQKNYQQSLDLFTKAVMLNQKAGSSVRIAISSCYFKLGQYDKAYLAAERAICLDHTNVNALVLLSLIQRVEAQKDKEKRQKCRQLANDLMVLATSIDANCSMALNHMANSIFHSWKIINCLSNQISSKTIVVSFDGKLERGDILRLYGSFIAFIDRIEWKNSSFEIILSDDIPLTVDSSKPMTVETVDLKTVEDLASRAFRSTDSAAIKSESWYIVGRIYHMRGNHDFAAQMYLQSLSMWPDMTLATFAMGQLLLEKTDLHGALEKFEEVGSKYPSDRDTQAYIILIKSLFENSQYSASMDKIREVCPGFQFEIDILLLQAGIKMRNPSEYMPSLKCYEQAVICLENKQMAVPSSVLSNMSTLHHHLGNVKMAVAYARKCLEAAPDVQNGPNIIFRSAQNDIFFNWSEAICNVSAVNDTAEESDWLTNTFAAPQGSNIDFNNILSLGDDVLVGDVVLQVEQIGNDKFTARGLVNVSAVGTWSLRKKISNNKFNDKNLTLCFNYARVMEDAGNVRASIEVYTELLKMHPSYYRLALISTNMGKLDDASIWLSRALSVSGFESKKELLALLGDTYVIGGQMDHAKTSFEKILKQMQFKHDSRALLSLGNMYFAKNISSKDDHLKQAQKFYFHALQQEKNNSYAANGLGMICAEHGKLDAARDIFSRIRESVVFSNTDVNTNLANVHFADGRYVEAEHIYQAILKNLPNMSNISQQTMKNKEISDALSFVYFRHRQYENALKVVLRSLLMYPARMHVWYNCAYLREENAISILQKQNKAVLDIEFAVKQLECAVGLFTSLKDSKANSDSIKYSTAKASDHASYCEDTMKKARLHLTRAKADEGKAMEARKKQDAMHSQKVAQLEDEKKKEMELKEQEIKEKQEKGLQKSMQLEKLLETWATAATETNPPKEKGEKKKGKSKQKTEKSDLPVVDYSSQEEKEEAADIFDSDEESNVNTSSGANNHNQNIFDSDDEAPVEKNGNNANNKHLIEDDDDDDKLLDEDTAGPPTKTRRLVLDDEE